MRKLSQLFLEDKVSNKLEDFKVGDRVLFQPEDDEWELEYTADGVAPGCVGTVTGLDIFDGDVVVNFTRQDGALCADFVAFPEDLEVING